MSALPAPQPSFHASLVLDQGVQVHINAPTLEALTGMVKRLQLPAANDTPTARAEAKPDPVPSPKADAGNAPASTATPASAPPAAAGSAASADTPAGPNYNDVKDRVLKLAKLGREKATEALGKFGVDHGNKLKLEQYADFIAHADKLLGVGNA